MFRLASQAARAASAAASAAARPAVAGSGEFSAQSWCAPKQGFAAFGAGSAALLGLAGVALADEAEHGLHSAQYPWPHEGMFDSYDHNSIRRGHQVYQQVCAACHSLNLVAYRNLVDVCYSEAEMKAMAEDTDVMDGPNDEGEMFERPGKLSDYLPSPYPNEEAARYANNGAYPPDLSLIVKARHGGADYIFALLTGYKDVPAGIAPRETQYYNPYFSGGWIGMPPPLADGAVDYDDGTPATATQMAKDVSIFLAWTSEPEQDERKLQGFKVMVALTVMFGFTWYAMTPAQSAG